MSQRRMFSPEIVESDEFLTMPISSQALYFHLGMNADDDGFIQPKILMRACGFAEDDLKILLAKRFLLAFDTGVVVIKHWLIHNMIRNDRYKPTRFVEEKKQLVLKENKAYTEAKVVGCQFGNQPAPQVRLGKVRLVTTQKTKIENQLPRQNNPAAKAAYIKINDDIMSLEEITYVPDDGRKSKSKYGSKTMMVFARAYLVAAKIELEPNEQYDANKISKGLSALYRQLKDPDKVIEALEIAGRYYATKGLDWTPITAWKNYEKIRQWHKGGEPQENAPREKEVAERRTL